MNLIAKGDQEANVDYHTKTTNNLFAEPGSLGCSIFFTNSALISSWIQDQPSSYTQWSRRMSYVKKKEQKCKTFEGGVQDTTRALLDKTKRKE